MYTVLLSRAQAVAAGASIAVLRGLYGDIGENLYDLEMCRSLWGQVLDEQERFRETLGVRLTDAQ